MVESAQLGPPRSPVLQATPHIVGLVVSVLELFCKSRNSATFKLQKDL